MSDWKQDAIDSYERHREEAELQAAEHDAFRVERAREDLIKALQELKIPLGDAEIRVVRNEDDAELDAIPFVTIDEVEFTLGPNGTRHHGGGLGIVTTCPRCQQKVRGPYIYDKVILGRELLNPERVAHKEDYLIDAEIMDARENDPSPSIRLHQAICDLIDLRIEEKTGAA